MSIAPNGRTIAGVVHHHAVIGGSRLHYVAAGSSGSPILLVHGFPETWWTFHKIIPMLAERHRVFAVDLSGFGDSSVAPADYSSSVAAADLHALIAHLDVGPVHLVAQDISGGTAFRLAMSHPGDVATFTAIEMGLAGFGLEGLADVTHGGTWHIGVLAAPGIPRMLLEGREEAFIDWSFRVMSASPTAIGADDIAEFSRTYARPGGWLGAAGLYRSMLGEGAEFRAFAQTQRLTMPVLAIGAGGGEFTIRTMSQVASAEPRSVLLGGVGHYAAMEAPSEVVAAILGFTGAARDAHPASE